MGIQNLELQLRPALNHYWDNLVAHIGTPNDLLPRIFENIPVTGPYGDNLSSIGGLFASMKSGTKAENLTFLLQFPIAAAHIPCISIEVMEEQEDEVVGSFIYEDNSLNDYIGGPYTKKYSIGVWSWEADTVLYLFSAIKYAMLDIRSSFTAGANFHISIRPMQVEPNKFEEAVYYRYFDVTLEGVLDTVHRVYEPVTSVTTKATEYYNNLNTTAK